MANLFDIIVSLVLLTSSIRISFWAIKFIWTYWLGYLLGFGVKWAQGSNQWAVVSGASNAVGREFAIQMASYGYNVLLIGRNEAKLVETRTKIIESIVEFKDIRILRSNYVNEDDMERTVQYINNLNGDIDELINAASVSHSFKSFTKVNEAQDNLGQILDVNIKSVTKLTETVLKRMEIQKRGIIINISSIYGLYPYPSLSLYAASKSFIDSFSTGIAYESQKQGVIVQTLYPNIIDSGQFKLSRPTLIFRLFSVKPDVYVKRALKTTGLIMKSAGHWSPELCVGWLKLLNHFISSQTIALIYMHATKLLFKKVSMDY